MTPLEPRIVEVEEAMPRVRVVRVPCCLLDAAGSYAAERYPDRPIPGSTTDTPGRIVFTNVSERLGTQIVANASNDRKRAFTA